MMIDESLDIAVKKKLVICFKLVQDGKPCVQFGTNCEFLNGKAQTTVTAVREYLRSIGVPIEKVIGVGTDGANIMTGCKNGVTTVLRRRYCLGIVSAQTGQDQQIHRHALHPQRCLASSHEMQQKFSAR